MHFVYFFMFFIF